MGGQKARIHGTDTENLISNLRGEVGEIITSWVLCKDITRLVTQKSGDMQQDLMNPGLIRLFILGDRLTDDMIARLSELSEPKVGRLTFHFASVKLNALQADVRRFATFIQRHRFDEKRNKDISHKECPETWSDHKYLHIPPRIILKAIARAVRLMKKFDVLHLGPGAKYLWVESRKKRYEPMSPPKIGYLLLPHIRLSNEDRLRVLKEELDAGLEGWDDMPTQFNGKPAMVKANKKWGIVHLGTRVLVMEQYPLSKIVSLSTEEPGEEEGKDDRSGT
ncbi:MAG TPA: hypothetical protein VI078_04655 [bacterium]